MGPPPESRGGIARVIEQATAITLPAGAPTLVLIPTYRDGGRGTKLAAWASGLVGFATRSVGRRPALAYVHISAGASTYRKLSFVALARALRVPVLLHVHPVSFIERLEQRTVGGRAARWCVRRAAAVVVLSASFVGRVHTVAPCTAVHVIPNAPNVDELAPPDPLAGRVPDRVLFVGSLLGDKGADVLLAAAELLAPARPELRLVIVGSGPDDAMLRRRSDSPMLAGCVEFRGWLEGDALGAEYARAALFVLSSRTEGLPLALLEAMWHGVPCVATAVGAVPELLADGVGVLVPPEDADALAAAIEQMLADPALAASYGARGAVRARERYAPAAQRSAIRDLLLRYASGGRNARKMTRRAHARDIGRSGERNA